MKPFEKILDGFFEHIGTVAALVVTGLIGWLFVELAPIVAPSIRTSLSMDVLLGMLGLSLSVNVALGVATWRLSSKRPTLRLMNGILWDADKNPHCPVCKNAGLNYAEWVDNFGYFCNNCRKTYSLQDASGNDVKPAEVLAKLKA
jgi:hypothetical protein